MDNYEKQLYTTAMERITEGLELLHRFLGRLEAREDFRPDLRFVDDGENVITFPAPQKTPESSPNAPTLKEVNAMLVELNVKLTARQRPDGRFEIRPMIGGKRKSIYGNNAEELAFKYKKMLKNTVPKTQPCMKLYEWFDEWLEVYKKPNVAENSLGNIERCISKHIKPNLENKPLSKYTPTELTIALNKIESTRMRKYARGVLQASFSCAVSIGKLASSPAQNLLPVKHVAQKGKAIALLELQKMIIQGAEQLDRRLFLYYLFSLFAGTRREEARLLEYTDCDFENKIIYIRGTKTEGSNRRVPMFPILEKILLATKANEAERPFPFGQHRADSDFRIFRGENTQAVLHWLRHTFGTVQICVELHPANTVALWMGHTDASTTMDIYTHPEDLAPDIYFSGKRSEAEKLAILRERYNEIISTTEKLL